jgi:glycosyltransferase involved in cell wall biosynthesis
LEFLPTYDIIATVKPFVNRLFHFMKTCAILPCYNVGSLCVPVIEQTRKYVDAILAVDDGSTDDTAAHLAETGVAILTHAKNAGKGAALISAFDYILASPDYQMFDTLLTIDGDGQHKPEEIPPLLEAYARYPNAVIIGTRNIDRRDIQTHRRIGNKLSRYFISKACRQHIPDTQSGFRVFSRDLMRDLLPHLGPGRYETETAFLILAARAGRKIVAAPISTIYTEAAKQVSSFDPFLDTYLVFKVIARSILLGK